MTAASNKVRRPYESFKARAVGSKQIHGIDFYAAAISDADAIPVSMTFRDEYNNIIDIEPLVQVGVSASNGGVPDTAIDSAAITGGGDGSELVDMGTSGVGLYKVGADGTLDITLTDANADVFYLFVIDNNGYRYNWNQALTFS